jgi:hypothetical protein
LSFVANCRDFGSGDIGNPEAPVSIALTLEQAQQTIEFLQREMLLTTQLPDQDQRH